MREEGAFTGPFWSDILIVGGVSELFGGGGGALLAAFYNYVFQPRRRIDVARFGGLCALCVPVATMAYVAIGHAVRSIFF